MTTNYQDLEKILKIKFNDLKLLEQAFTHRSYLNEAKGKYLSSNERLEFLGDSVLSFVTSEFIFDQFPKLAEGELTSYRSALVCSKSLAKVAKGLNLGVYLKMSKGEVDGGGKNNPTLLANTVEALIGAIYLDQGLEKLKVFIKKFILSTLSEIIAKKAFRDYKSYLQEIIQEKTKITPIYQVLDSWGPDHDKTFKVGVFVGKKLVAEGSGKSKQEGEQEAAKIGIENWKKMR